MPDSAVPAQPPALTDAVALQAEVRRLASEQRLSIADIGAALRLSPPQVRELLAATGPEAAELHAQAWHHDRVAKPFRTSPV